MKKLFLMGAVASLGLLASCSSDDDLSTGGKNDLQQIKIGMGVQATVGATRGTGTVGGVGADNNKWAGQAINIYMFKKGTLDVAQFDGVDIYNDAAFYAPTTASTGLATAADHSVKYYPTQSAFDFWGYRLDDAIQGTPDVSEDGTKQEVGFTLDGSQDIMVGKATPTEDDLTKCADAEKIYSAYAARRGVQPDIKFKHLLSRLVFSITGGNKDACDDESGVKVTGIKVKSKYTGKLIVAYTPDAEVTNELVPTEDVKDLVLMQRATDDTNGNNKLIALEAKNPEWDTEADKAKKTNIGEAILAVPADNYELTIELSQKVKIQEAYSEPNPEGGEPINHPAEYDFKNFSYTDVIKLTDDVFKAGYSYNVNITVYGLSEIKINTTLTPWEDGGNIDMNPEDDGTPGVTPTPATYEFEEVTEGTEAAEPTVYPTLEALKDAVTADATTEGKIYKVGTDPDFKYYKVTKKTTTPAPTVTYEFEKVTEGTEAAEPTVYPTLEALKDAVTADATTEGKIYKVGTDPDFNYYKVTKKTV